MRRLALLALALSACQSPVENCGAGAPVTGTWRYAGAQESPVHASLSGSLSITAQSCEDFSGQLDLLVTDELGQSRRLAGPVTGRIIDATTLRFDAYLDATSRQHIGSIAADSIAGSWVAIGGDAGQTLAGTFVGRREDPR